MEVLSIGKSSNIIMEFPPHQHGYWEMVYNYKGSGTLEMEGSVWNFKPGTVALIPPGTTHYKKSDNGFMDISIFVKNLRPIGEAVGKCFQDDEMQSLYKLFDMAYGFFAEAKEISDGRRYVILNSLGDAIYQILGAIYAKGKNKDIRIQNFTEKMEANISNTEFNLSREIDRLGYSKGYFRKVFKEITGESPVNYFNRIKIENAKKEFEHYGKSRNIKDVALASGFKDQYYFSRVFRKIEGMCPQAYLDILGEYEIQEIDKDGLRDKFDMELGNLQNKL